MSTNNNDSNNNNEYHVLLVEDDQDYSKALHGIIKRRGYRVTLKTTAEEALEFLKDEQVHVIVSDIKLPHMDGVSFLEHVHNIDPSLPVIMLTGYASVETAQNAVRLHAFDYLQKPLDNIEQLLRPLGRAIEKYNLQIANESLNGELKLKVEELEESREELEQKTKDLGKLYDELLKSNEELKKLDQLKTEFVSTVSHELRTPLTITKESLNLLRDRIPGEINPTQERIVTTAIDNLARLGRIINDLLDISRIESGDMDVKRSLVNLADLASKVVLSFSLEAEKKGLDLKARCNSKNPTAYVDEDKIVQVFFNLVENAIKYTDRGCVEIELSDRDDSIECSVRDTGIGIPEEYFAKVFQKFQQFSRTHGAGRKGTGLGLSIVRGIVTSHQGRITFASKQGEGSEFKFTLPRPEIKMSKEKTCVA